MKKFQCQKKYIKLARKIGNVYKNNKVAKNVRFFGF